MAQSPHRWYNSTPCVGTPRQNELSFSWSYTLSAIQSSPVTDCLSGHGRPVWRSCSDTISHTVPYSKSWKTLCDYCTSSGEALVATFVWLLNHTLRDTEILSSASSRGPRVTTPSQRVEMWLRRHWETSVFLIRASTNIGLFPLRGYIVCCTGMVCKHTRLVSFINLRLSSLAPWSIHCSTFTTPSSFTSPKIY